MNSTRQFNLSSLSSSSRLFSQTLFISAISSTVARKTLSATWSSSGVRLQKVSADLPQLVVPVLRRCSRFTFTAATWRPTDSAPTVLTRSTVRAPRPAVRWHRASTDAAHSTMWADLIPRLWVYACRDFCVWFFVLVNFIINNLFKISRPIETSQSINQSSERGHRFISQNTKIPVEFCFLGWLLFGRITLLPGGAKVQRQTAPMRLSLNNQQLALSFPSWLVEPVFENHDCLPEGGGEYPCSSQ